MAYDKFLAQKVREELASLPGIEEKKMFGGVGFLLHGNMACGILNNDLIVRVGPGGYESALKEPGTRKFAITGRVMKGWVMVSGKALDLDSDLEAWVNRGLALAKTLPPK